MDRLPSGKPLSWVFALPLLALVLIAAGYAGSRLEIGGPACYAYVLLHEDGTWTHGKIRGAGTERDTWSGWPPKVNGRDCALRTETR